MKNLKSLNGSPQTLLKIDSDQKALDLLPCPILEMLSEIIPYPNNVYMNKLQECYEKEDNKSLTYYDYALLPWDSDMVYLSKTQGDYTATKYACYKPVIHFSEHINRLIHTQSITYPSFLLQWLQFHVGKHLSSPDIYFLVRKTLKKHKLSKYNEHIHYFIALLSKTHLTISHTIVQAMKQLFIQIFQLIVEQPWLPRKHNCLSYYCIVQFFFYLFQIQPLYRLPTILNVSHRYVIYETLYICYTQTQFYHHFHLTLPKRQIIPFLDNELSLIF